MIGTTEITQRYQIPLRNLQWLDERGYIKPHIFGHTRRYDDEQLRLLLLVRRLREKKIPLQRIVPRLPSLKKLLARYPDTNHFCFCGKGGMFNQRLSWHHAHEMKILAAKDTAELLKLAAKHRGWFFVVEI